uniref:Secreted protein n=1 Tax=Strongyloides venezuelensis TaxID=75913 RepID=A0A0K0FET3_STRVS
MYLKIFSAAIITSISKILSYDYNIYDYDVNIYYDFSVTAIGNATWKSPNISDVKANITYDGDSFLMSLYVSVTKDKNFTVYRHIPSKDSIQDDVMLNIKYTNNSKEEVLKKNLSEICLTEKCLKDRDPYNNDPCICYFNTIHLD